MGVSIVSRGDEDDIACGMRIANCRRSGASEDRDVGDAARADTTY